MKNLQLLVILMMTLIGASVFGQNTDKKFVGYYNNIYYYTQSEVKFSDKVFNETIKYGQFVTSIGTSVYFLQKQKDTILIQKINSDIDIQIEDFNETLSSSLISLVLTILLAVMFFVGGYYIGKDVGKRSNN